MTAGTTPTAPAPTVQVVLDCRDPHAQGDFWGAALAYQVEDVAELVERMLGAGFATAGDVGEHRGHRVWRDATALSAPGGAGPRLYLQRVPEDKVAKNRLHLDLKIGPDHRDAEVERLVGLGASRLDVRQQGPLTWVVLTDPEGNEFCVS